MAKLYNRVAVATATTGTGTVTLGAVLSNAFCTFAEAGAQNGDVVTYLLTEGNNFELGRGTYTATGTTLSRDTVLLSKIDGAAGTTKMTLAGAAEVRVIAAAEDVNSRFRVLAASAVAVSHTGSTAETALDTVTIPANSMGANGVLRITTLWSYTNSAGAKTLRTRLGSIAGVGYMAVGSLTTGQTYRDQRQIANRNSTASQVGAAAGSTGGWHVGNAAVVTSAYDTTAALNIVFTGQLAAGTDTVTLESYLIEVLYRP